MSEIWCHFCEEMVDTNGEGCALGEDYQTMVCPVFVRQDREGLETAFMLGRKEKDDG